MSTVLATEVRIHQNLEAASPWLNKFYSESMLRFTENMVSELVLLLSTVSPCLYIPEYPRSSLL